ncbi:MAG TPA: polysaccharide deacetylase family protein [Chthoniobacterales bacterium]
MKHTGGPIFLATTVFVLTACQSVHTQTNPSLTREAPPVMSIHAQPPAAAPTPSVETPTRLTLTPPPPESAPVASTDKPHVPAGPRFSYSSVVVSEPYVAITFDDGPSAGLTPKLLDMLKERGIPATFYVVGTNAAAHPEILQRMIAEGHEIGNHSWSHPALTRVGGDGVKNQMDKTSAAIHAATGNYPATMRPPYGATSAYLTRRLNEEFGLKVIMWSVDPLDWKYRNADRVANAIITSTKPGDIILAHDIHASTVAAMPRTLDALQAKGFKFVTVSTLLKMDEGSQLTQHPSPVQMPTATVLPANP